MDIIISNSSGVPIYEQIVRQVKGLILSGELPEGEALPSMRLLARDLRISVITTKRAYEELERDGFLTTVPGKGCFVAPQNQETRREAVLCQIEEHLSQAVDAAKAGADRVELYTEPYATMYPQNPEAAIAPFIEAAKVTRSLGMGLNAGHDLSLVNLKYMHTHIPWLDEVSIGHALISDALYMGLKQTIEEYKNCLRS